MHDIKTKVLSALRWTAGARTTAQLLTWAVTLVVIRLLAPADYGLMAMSEVIFSLLLMMSSAGLGSALIQAKDVNRRQVRQLFGLLLLVNGGLCLLQVLAAPAIAAYYREPRVVPICRVLALGFLLVPFIEVPSALLSRDIDFKRKSIVELVASTVSVVSTLAFALAGAGVWSLVLGRLLNLVVRAVGLQRVRPFLEAPLFSFRAAREIVRFGGVFTATTILWFLYTQVDVFLAGRALEPGSLGLYAVAMHLASLAVAKLMPLLNQVALPAYSRLQHDPSAVRYYFLKVVRLVSLLAFPLFLGLASVAAPFVRAVLGPAYEGAIAPLVLLCLHMPVRLVSNLFPAPVYAMGRPGVEFGNTLFGLVVMPLAFLLGLRWGVTGLCTAWLAAFPVVFGFQLVRSCRVMGLPPRDVLRALLPATRLTLCMCAAVQAALLMPVAILGAAGQLVLLTLLGAGVYAALLGVLARPHLRDAFATLRNNRAA